MKRRRSSVIFSYAAAPLLVALITWAMAAIQNWLLVHPDFGSPRAFTTLFFGGIALVSLLGGRGPGLWTLGLSLVFTAYFVMTPRYSLGMKSAADIAQLALFLGVGVMMIEGVEALATNRRLLTRSEEAQAKLRAVMDTAPVGVVLSDARGVLSYANREAERIWGHAFEPEQTDAQSQGDAQSQPGEAEPLSNAQSQKGGKRHASRMLDADGTPTPPDQWIVARALAGEPAPVRREHLVEQPDGTRVWVESVAALVRDGGGRMQGALAVMSDITGRKEAELALRAREERFRSLVQNASDIITVLAEDGTVLYKSPSEERIMGFAPSEAVGRAIFETIHPDDAARVAEAFGRVLAAPGLHAPVEFRLLHKDGTWRHMESTPSNLLADPSIGGIVVNSRDITERKAADAEIRALLMEGLRQAERETLLSRIAQTVLETPSPDAVLAATVAGLGPALGADRCYYVSYDLAGNTSRIGPEWHRDGLPGVSGNYVMSDYGFNRDGRYQLGQTQAVPDTFALEPVSSAAVAKLGLRSLLRVPVRRGDRMTALVAAMAHAPRVWQADEIALVETVASQTRVAMEAARLQQREHNIATALQSALMPALPSHVPGLEIAAYYRPALEESSLGGDFHDVFPLDKGLFALVVGDVSGKGLAAASQVATVRQMLRYALYLGTSHGQSLSHSVSELNSQVVAHDLLMGFVTLFVAVYDAASSRLTYVNAGQEPALLRRARSGEIAELAPTGPVLGMDMGAVFTEDATVLVPGDSLAIYTDGISEAGRGKLDLLGVGGVAALMGSAPPAAAAQVAHLVSGMNVHAEGNLHDDVCVLIAVAQSGDLRLAPQAA